MNQTSEVPFSWENKPGVSKVITRQHQQQEQQHNYDGEKPNLSQKVPPPPCPDGGSRRFSTTKVLHDIQIPLPPCAFQPPPPHPPSRSSSRKGLMMMNMKHHDQDPFLVAFMECTKTRSTRKSTKLLPKNSYKGMFNFSCKRSCSVRDDTLVRVSQLPCKKDEDEEICEENRN